MRRLNALLLVLVLFLVCISSASAADVTALGNLTEGSIVYINENGSPVEFYVAKHDYESGLNGTGRTLLVRKDCYGNDPSSSTAGDRAWHNTYISSYASSTINTWLNGDYMGSLDADIQNAIEETTFYYTVGGGNTTKTTLNRAVFLLSLTELGKSSSYANKEGSALPIFSTLQVAYRYSYAINQWTRTPYSDGENSSHVFVVTDTGSLTTLLPNATNGIRPCFTLPATLAVTSSGTVLTYAVPASLTAVGPREYRAGETFVPGDVSVTVTYHDGTEKLVSGSNCDVVLTKVS